MEDFPRVYLYRRVVQAKLFIDEHYSDAIDLDNIANKAFFSKFHFIRLFKSIYEKTPNQYLVQVRMENAKRLLGEGLPIPDVCYGVGFESISSFSGLFKKLFGTTPAFYQRQQLATRSETIRNPLKFIPHCFANANGWVQNRNFEEKTE